MANWCSNTVVFEGNPETIEQIKWLFQTMATKEQQEQKGQLPEFVNQYNGGYFFDLYFDNEETAVFQYQTKWSPNIEIIQEIAEYYKVDFVQDYEEMGNLIYGQAIHHNEILQDIYLEDEVLNSMSMMKKTIAIILRTKNLIATTKSWKSF